MTCDRCYLPMANGEHGIGLCPYERRRDVHQVKQDTIVGGFLAENAWRAPRWFDSQKQYERALDASGLMLKEKKPKGSRAIDAQTLENARLLVTRNAPPLESFSLETRVLEETFTVQAEA